MLRTYKIVVDKKLNDSVKSTCMELVHRFSLRMFFPELRTDSNTLTESAMTNDYTKSLGLPNSKISLMDEKFWYKPFQKSQTKTRNTFDIILRIYLQHLGMKIHAVP